MDLAEGHINALDALARSYPSSSPATSISEQATSSKHKDIFSGLDIPKEGRFRAFNLGRGKGLSVLDMVRAMKEATGFEYQYEIVGRRYVLPPTCLLLGSCILPASSE
jgi:UDP-glucose 4-epimerase